MFDTLRRVGQYLSFSFVLSFSGELTASITETSREISRLNEIFNQYSEYPILIFDKAEISPLLKNKENNEQMAILADYTNEKFDVDLNENQLSNILDYLVPLAAAAYSVPFYKPGWDKGYEFCAVFPVEEIQNSEKAIERILGVSEETRVVYKNYPIASFKKRFSGVELSLLSLYHELSHCLDQTNIALGVVRGHAIHKAEAFAEAHALLMYFQRYEMNDLISLRKELRRAYSHYMGPWLANNTRAGYELVYREGGAVYYLTPVVSAVGEEIALNGDAIKYLSLNKSLELAQKIANEHSLDGMAFAALKMVHQSGSQETLIYYQKLVQHSPELFRKTFEKLKKMLIDSTSSIFIGPVSNEMENDGANLIKTPS